jgi:TonB-dependent receptor
MTHHPNCVGFDKKPGFIRIILLCWLLSGICPAFLPKAQGQEPVQLRQLTEKVTLHVQQTNMLAVIRELDRQSAYSFTYDERSLGSVNVASLQVDNTTLGEVLATLRREYHLVFAVREQNISVKLEQPPAPVTAGPQTAPYIVTGQVRDLATGKPLVHATVTAEGESETVETDEEGRFSLTLHHSGVTITITNIGYASQHFREDHAESRMIALRTDARTMTSITVTAQRKVNTEAALLNERRVSAVVSDGISAQQMAKTASLTTVQALARVTGVSVTDDKYVAIRGMGDRSVIAELNGARLSSSDPDRSSVPLDLVPASLLDNVTVYKTMTPDRPADASGGIIELKTKSIPDSLTLEFTVQLGTNSVIGLSGSFNSFQGANLGFLGQKVKPNDLGSDFLNLKNQYPGGLPQIQEMFLQSRNSPALAAEASRVNTIMQSFPAVLTTSYQSAAPNQVYGVSFGNNFQVFHGHQLGLIVSGSYYSRTEDRYNAQLNQYSVYQGVVTGSASIFNPLTIPSFITPNDPRLGKYLGYTENTGITTLNYGVLTGLTYRFNTRNQVQFQYLGSRGAESRGANLNGAWQNTGLQFPVYNQVNQLVQTYRVFNTYNLQGEHKLLNKSWSPELSYNLSASKSSQDQPDFRFTDLADYRQVSFANPNGVGVVNDTYAFVVGSVQGVGPNGSIGADPNGRDYRFLKENNYNGKADLTLPFHVGGQRQLLKFGYNYLRRERNYTESILGIPGSAAGGDLSALAAAKGDLNELVSSANIGLKAPSNYNNGGQPRVGGFLYQIRKSPNNYTGTYETEAAYAMADVRLGERWRLTGGVRFEGTKIQAHVDTTNVFNPLVAEGTVGAGSGTNLQSGTSQPNTAYAVNWKPYYSANLTYNWRRNMNFRLAYSTTLARPELRELTNIYEFDPFQFAVVAGNPALQNQLTKSYDFRWEWFPHTGEVFSASVFGKQIYHQLNKVFIYTPQGAAGVFPQFPLIEYQNDPNRGQLVGIELEARKNLGLWWQSLNHFSVGTNFMWAYSEITKNPARLDAERTIDRLASSKSPLFEQPPYSLNAYLDYDNPKTGSTLTASFNIVGERLIQLQLDGSPDIYSRPVPLLDIVFSQHIWRRLNMKGFAKNILNAAYRDVYSTPGTDGLYHGIRYIQHQYYRGTEYTLGFTYDLF